MNEKKQGWFEKTDQVIVRVVRVLSYGATFFLIAIMLMAFLNVLGERILHKGIPSSTEWIQNFHVPVVFLAAAYVTLDQGHTRIDLVSKRFPKKVQKFFTAIGFLLGAFICGYVSKQGFARMNNALTRREYSSTSAGAFPLWPFILVLAVGFAMLSLSFIWAVVRLYKAEPKEDDAMLETASEQEVEDHE